MLPNQQLQGLLGSMQGMAPGMVNGGLLSPNFGNWGRKRQMNYLQGQTPHSPFQGQRALSPQMMRQLMGGLLGGRQMIAPVPDGARVMPTQRPPAQVMNQPMGQPIY